MKKNDDKIYNEAVEYADKIVKIFGKKAFNEIVRRNVVLELRAAYIHGYKMAEHDALDAD